MGIHFDKAAYHPGDSGLVSYDPADPVYMTPVAPGVTFAPTSDPKVFSFTAPSALGTLTVSGGVQGTMDSGSAQVTAPPPPPPTLLWGSSGYDSGPTSYAQVATLLGADAMRSYDSGPVNGWASCAGAKVPVGLPPFHSAKWDPNKVAAGDSVTMGQIRDWLMNGPGWRCWHHEPEGDFPVSLYQQAYARIVALGVGLDRLAPCLMGYTLGKAGKWTKWGDPDQYYIPQAGMLAFDCYSSANQDMTQFDEAAKYAARKAKPWIIAEAGWQTKASWEAAGSHQPSDDTLIAWGKVLVSHLKAYPNPPVSVLLMNHGPQTTSVHPQFAAWWKGAM